MLHSLALHSGTKELDSKLITLSIVGKLTTEVAIASCPIARHYGYVLGKCRYKELALQVEHAFGLKLLDYLLATSHKIAHGIFRINVGHYPRESICRMKLCLYTQHYLHACMQTLPSYAFKHRPQHCPSRRPALGRGLGYGRIRSFVFLHKLHIAMATHLACLA